MHNEPSNISGTAKERNGVASLPLAPLPHAKWDLGLLSSSAQHSNTLLDVKSKELSSWHINCTKFVKKWIFPLNRTLLPKAHDQVVSVGREEYLLSGWITFAYRGGHLCKFNFGIQHQNCRSEKNLKVISPGAPYIIFPSSALQCSCMCPSPPHLKGVENPNIPPQTSKEKWNDAHLDCIPRYQKCQCGVHKVANYSKICPHAFKDVFDKM